MISLAALKKIVGQQSDSKKPIYQGKCFDCGYVLKIETSKTSGGYGLLGGVLCESGPQNIFALCTNCYENSVESKLLSDFVKADPI